MLVALFGAGGTIGSAIADELVARDHQVTGMSRTGAPGDGGTAGVVFASADVTDRRSVAEHVVGHDAVVSAIGPALGSGAPQPFVRAAYGLIAGLRATGVRRLLVVGGAGSLEVAPGVQAVDSPGFPVAYKRNALAQREALAVYRTVDDLDWTYVSPAAEIGPGEHIGDYQVGHHQMLYDEAGVSSISYADYADGVVDCLEQGTHIGQQITLAN